MAIHYPAASASGLSDIMPAMTTDLLDPCNEPEELALDRLKDLSADTDARRLAFVRERALRDEASELRAAMERGKLEGKIEGELKGKIEGESAALQRLLARRFGALPPETLSRIAGASREEIEAWLDRVLDARSLADVFAPTAH